VVASEASSIRPPLRGLRQFPKVCNRSPDQFCSESALIFLSDLLLLRCDCSPLKFANAKCAEPCKEAALARKRSRSNVLLFGHCVLELDRDARRVLASISALTCCDLRLKRADPRRKLFADHWQPSAHCA
jgi:hypothetical protein